MKLSVEISDNDFQDALYLSTGLYNPLNGFMNESDYRSVIDNLRLDSEVIWPLPITLPIPAVIFSKICKTNQNCRSCIWEKNSSTFFFRRIKIQRFYEKEYSC